MQLDSNGLLKKEPYSGDIATAGYYLHQQAVCWRGMRDMATVYRELGFTEDSTRYGEVASRLKRALEIAIEKSQKLMSEDRVFIPTHLLTHTEPYDPITGSKLGTYWNLVFPYGLASGLLSQLESGRVLNYMINHGSFFLGLLRCNYYPVEIGSHRQDGLPGYSTSGADNVYLVNVIDALAEHDHADRIVLSLYGKLAHGMTRETFIAGEGDSYGVVPDEYYRAMYLPPSSANNSLLLKILRTMMLYERTSDKGKPEEILLAHFTPRAWLENGKKIRFAAAPSLFGKVSLKIVSELDHNRILVDLDAPERPRAARMKLRLRTPGKRRLVAVTVNDVSHAHFDPDSETIDLSGKSGELRLLARYEKVADSH